MKPRPGFVHVVLVWMVLSGIVCPWLIASDFEPHFPKNFGHGSIDSATQAETGGVSPEFPGQPADTKSPLASPFDFTPREGVQPALWDQAIHAKGSHLNLQQHLQDNRRRLFGDRPWIVDGPSVPEPMLFDMVRPMNARRGELEMNVLGIVPLHARRAELDWAPEIEYAIADGVAVEFEFPFLDSNLEALKFAVQYTFDVGLNNRLIHGYHGIYEYVFDGQLSQLTSLYMVGLQLNETWSVVGMFGFRSTIESEARSHFTELIQNVSFFANVTEKVIVGVETNMSHHLAGPSTLLIMPQVHWDLTDNLNLQFGFGLQAASDHAVALHAFRVVWEF